MSKNQVIDYTSEVQKLTPIIKEQVELMKSFAESSKKAYASLPSDFQKQQREQLRLEQENEKLRQQSIRTQQQLEDLARRQITTARENQRLQAQNRREEEAQERTRQRAEAQQARANRQLEQENSAYLQLQKRWREAQRAYADLVVSQGRNSEATVRARQEFERLNTQLTTVDGLVRNYSRNVGNYASAFNGVGAGIGKLMGAFGVVGGLTTGVAILKDAFQIMRDFDEEMVNLGAIAGKTRPELASLEKVIRDTASASLNTARDVAKVATELIKLGSSTEEAEKLIPTVNNLSIALRASADETAELLKSSLNAFGAGADEAKRYGDVIAGMANKSALDFGRIRDAMSYIAPVAKALGYTIEETGALIGVLVDNGIKAESAGRLLRTAMIKLQGQGLSLNQALEQIKNSSDQTTTAYNLMGAEASTLGVVLANNTDKLKDLTIELQNSGGALQELADKQLASLSAKMNIARSAWEEFVLSVENGEGIISKVVSKMIVDFTNLVNAMTKLNNSDAQNYANEQMKNAEGYAKFLEKDFEKFINRQREIAKLKGIEYTDEMRNADLISRKRTVIDGERLHNIKQIKDIESEITKLEEKREKSKGGGNSIRINREVTEKTNELLKKQEIHRSNIIALQKVENELNEQSNKVTEVKKGGVTDNVLSKKAQREADNAEKERLRLVEEITKSSAELKRRELQSDIENEKERSLMLSQSKGQQLLIEMQYQSRLFEVAELNRQENLRQAGDAQHKQLLAWQTYWEELEKLSKSYNKANADYQTETDKQLSDSAKKVMEEAKKDFDARKKMQEAEAERVRKLAENTKNYLSKFSDMGQFGFSSLNIFTEVDEQGNTMFENLLKGADDWKKKTAVIVGAVGEIVKDVMGAINQASQARFDAEMGRLQIEYETSLTFAGDSVEARERLEEQLNEKQRELKKKQAKKDKEFAIMGANINTAQAVVVALTAGPIIGPILAGIAGALGAIQIATIASTPIPEFWNGTMDAPEGLALTQERGAEVITDKNNNVKTWGHNKGATLTYLNKGDKVYKSQEDYFKEQDEGFNNELNSILASNRISPIIVNNGVTKEEMTEVMQNTLGKQPKYSTVVDENGINTYWQTKDSRQKIKNRSARR